MKADLAAPAAPRHRQFPRTAASLAGFALSGHATATAARGEQATLAESEHQKEEGAELTPGEDLCGREVTP
jgi:hypothetical protein